MGKLYFYLSKLKKLEIVLFILLLFLVSYFYEYGQSNYLTPQSLHNWRQADCASFAMMYYDNGMHFFEPKVYNVLMGEGNAVGECPILYYVVACIYKIYGPDESVFRFVNLIIFYFGMIALYGIVKRLLKDRFFAFIIPFLFYSSPLIMLFANGFLCDVSSLSMTFIAWNFILRYRENKRQKYFWLSMLFFTLAGLLKLNSAISFVALGAVFFIELNGWQKTSENNIFVHKRNNIIGFVLALLIIASWYAWAINYNNHYNVSFLGTKTWPGWPIWETTDQTFVGTINGYFGDSVYVFFQVTYALVIFLTFFINANRQSLDKFFYTIFLLTLIGVFLFIATFFLGIRDNIYYVINLLILPVFIFIFSALLIKTKYPIAFKSIVFRLIIFFFLLVNINYANSTLKDFYHGGKLHYRLNENFSNKSFHTFIDSIGIKKTDKVISFPDGTPDASLYSIRRQGWSEYNIPRTDTNGINYCIKNGAKYLIVNCPNILAEPAMENYSGNYFAHYDNIYVYKLGEGQRNKRNKNIRLKTSSNHFMAFADQAAGKKVICVDSAASPLFYFLDFGNGSVALKCATGEFVSCDMNTDKKLFINTTWLGSWETFELVKQKENSFALKAVNGKFVSFKENEGNILKADADSIGSNETFTFN